MTAEEKIKHYNNDYSVNDELLNAVKDFAQIKCKEQREICAEELKGKATVFDILNNNTEIILNSTEPEI